MKLLNLNLINFKGIREFSLDTKGGQDVEVRADNERGKTTLADSFYFILFGKDSLDNKNFEIKTLNPDGSVIHGLDHEAESMLKLPSGKRIALKKVYKEKWTQKKGTTNKIFSGHTTDHFVDEVPVPAKEYQDTINKLVDEEAFKLLTSPKYFAETLHWTKRRETLLEVCGDITDADVIASDKALAKLPGILGDHALDKYKDMIKAKRAKINEELKNIPVRIDEKFRGLPDVTGTNAEIATEKIELLKGSVRKREQAISRIESGGEVAEKTKLLREIEAEMQEIKNSYTKDLQEKVSLKKAELSEIDTGTGQKIHRLNNDVTYIVTRIESLQERMKVLREQYLAKDAEEFTFEQEDVCPTCNQSLPAEQLEQSRQKADQAFKFAKAEELHKIKAEGVSYKEEVANLEDEKKNTEAEIVKLQAQAAQETKKAEALLAEVRALEEKVILAPPSYTKKKKQKAEIEEVIAGLKGGSSDEKAKIYEEIAQLESSVKEAERVIADLIAYKQGQERIEELKRQEEKLAAEYAGLEEELYLCDEFTKTKVKLLDEKINSKFEFARFKMFNQNINGGIEPCCEVLYKGVPYSTNLNSGHRIIVGMDIIRTLAKHYDFYPPICVDNAESVTVLPEMDQQVIRLVKPEILTDADRKKYSKLVVEVQEKIMEEAV